MSSLSERLLAEGGASQASTSFTRKRVVLALLGVIGVACLVVGSVAASGAFSLSPSPSSSASSASGQSFSVIDPNLLQRRPNFAAPLGSLASAPEPTIIAADEHTQTATLNFSHTRVTAQGQISHTQLSYTVVKRRNAHCPSTHESVLAIDCLPSRIRISFANASKAREYAADWKNETILFLRAEWGCGSHIRQFVQHPEVDGRFLYAWTANTSFAAAFPHANISFNTNHTGDEGPIVLRAANQSTSASTPQQATPPGRETRSHHNLWDKIKADLRKFVDKFMDKARALLKVASKQTDDLDNPITAFDSALHISQTDCSAIDLTSGSVTEFGYHGRVAFTSRISIETQNSAFKNISVSMFGSSSIKTALQLQAQGQFFIEPVGCPFDDLRAGWGYIEIFGIPMVLSTYVSVTAGFDAGADSSGTLTSAASFSSHFTAGFSWNPTNGFQPLMEINFEEQLAAVFPQSPPSTAASSFAVSPVIYLDLDAIGSATTLISAIAEDSLTNNCQFTQTASGTVQITPATLEISGESFTSPELSLSTAPITVDVC